MLRHKKCLSIVIIIIVAIAMTFIYIFRTKIYYPLEICVAELPSDGNNEIRIKTINVLGKENVILPNRTNKKYYLINGYYNKLVIENFVTNRDSIFNHVKLYSLMDNNLLNYEYEYDYANDKLIIYSVGQKSTFNKITRIIIVNLKYIVFLFFIIFVLFIYKRFQYLITKYSHTINLGIIIVSLIYGCSLLFIAASYSYPNAEDISLSPTRISSNYIENSLQILLAYDARYTTNFLYGLNVFALGGVDYHKLNSILVILITILSVFLFFVVLTKNLFKKKIIFFYSLFFVLFHFAYSPGIAYDLFYIGSSYVYLLAWIFVFIWVMLFVLIPITSGIFCKAFYALGAYVFMFLSMGSVELNLILNFSIIVALWYYFYLQKKQLLNELIVLSVIYVSCVVFVLLIPGNTLRIFGSPVSFDFLSFLNTLSMTFIPYLNVLIHWQFLYYFTIPTIIIITILLFKNNLFNPLNISIKKTSILLICILITMYICYFVFVFSNKNLFNNGYPIRLINYINWGLLIVFYVLCPLALIKVLYPFMKKNNDI